MILNITGAIVITPKTLQVACHSAFLLSSSHSYAATIFVTHAVPSSGHRPNMGTLQGSYPRSSPSLKAIYDDSSLALALHLVQGPVFRGSVVT